MSRLRLSMACWDYDRSRPLLDGSIRPEGIDLRPIVLPPGETFARMWQYREFDASEMSLADYATMTARGECPFIAIPVFPSRFFRHSCIYINAGSGIRQPQDLAGKRVGSPQYQMTAAVFARGMLHREYGVAPESVQWLWGGQESPGAKERIPLRLPARIRLEKISEGNTLSAMLEAGELDALITPNFPSPFLAGSPRVVRLFPKYAEVERDYYRRTKIFPIMHTFVLKKEVYEQNPWAAHSLYVAWVKARDAAYRELYETDALKITLPWVVSHTEEMRGLMGADFWPYGVKANRMVLDALAQYLVEQGLAPRAVTAEELFAPNTLDT
ncbi:MAG: ABC transporter substrate-binding protein [Dehalococcoidia bacterium]|nr:ABC transporter substrate-binding protein [Dehalococcoidia bacterium]